MIVINKIRDRLTRVYSKPDTEFKRRYSFKPDNWYLILYKYSTWDVIFKYNKEDNLKDLLYSKGVVVGSLFTNPKEYEVYRIKSDEAAREIMMLEELKK